jgi:hypothetical protein
MNDDAPMAIRFGDLWTWSVPMAAVVGGLGAVPTWTWAGRAGLLAEALAAPVSLLAAGVGGWMIRRAAGEGPARAAAAFAPAEGYRGALTVVLGAVGWLAAPVGAAAWVLWLLIFYLALLFCTVVWLVKALRRDARRVQEGHLLRFFLPRRPDDPWDDV